MQHTPILIYENIGADIYTFAAAEKYGKSFSYVKWPIYTEKEFEKYLHQRGFNIIPRLATALTINEIKKNHKDSIVYTSPKLYKPLSLQLRGHERRGLIRYGYFQYVLPALEDPEKLDYYISNVFIDNDDFPGNKKNLVDYQSIYRYEDGLYNYEERILDKVTKCDVDIKILEKVIKNKDLFNRYIVKGFTNSNYSDVVFCLNKNYINFGVNSNEDIERGRRAIFRTIKILETKAKNVSGNIFTSSAIYEIFKRDDGHIGPTRHEYLVGVLATNRLRQYIPNFAMVYGLFNCAVKEDEDKNLFFDCEENTERNVLAYERVIDSISFGDFCDKSNLIEIYKIVFQIVLSLSMAYEKYGFVHGDLHDDNVLVKYLDEPITVKYNINNEDVYITTKIIPVIIDYGFSLIKYEGRTLIDTTYFQNEATQFPMKDIFKLICSAAYDSPKIYRLFRFFVPTNSKEDAVNIREKYSKSLFLLPTLEKYLSQTHGDYFLFMKQEFRILLNGFIKYNNDGKEIFGCANSFCEIPEV